ncbi:hypothetical protein PsYK624_141150 [Phanerochaete sordida]|uniref:Uncharacterized protein n=1 Tax=Phanerochaete sordida TaxID=48140 RepID=A0A9P3GL75_9APHY|nr:hypothetical protein PsYK624_141150 [Phanerochaete sordida]
MRSFTLEQDPISYASPLLEELAEAWPRPQTLVMQPHLDLYHECLPLLADLLYLARRCSALREVDVEFEPASDAWRWHAPGKPAPDVPSSMQTTYTEPAAAPAVATFLDRYSLNAWLSGEVNADELVHCSVGYVN